MEENISSVTNDLLDPPYDGYAVWHEHFFAPDGHFCPIESDDPAVEVNNETFGRYDAVEDRRGRIFVLRVEDWVPVKLCADRDEACRVAQGLATI